MSNNIKLEQFEGPLDLLLQLIEDQKLNITELSLADITEQYFDYLNKLDESRPEELADFLVIATKLVYLKSKNLLPYLLPEEDEGPSLADQLKLYKRYADASKVVEKMWQKGKVAYGRVEPPLTPQGFVMPINAKAGDLRLAMSLLLNRLRPVNPLPTVSIDRTISVRQKVEAIYNALKQWKKISFKDILGRAESRTEVIVSFLALLELVKQQKVSISQPLMFEEMVIERT